MIMRNTTEIPAGREDLAATGMTATNTPLASIERLFAVARPEAVFSEPKTVGDSVLITASEVRVSMGLGFGGGTGTATDGKTQGGGSGGGGGGGSKARPVAVIAVGPAGVRITPIIDVSRLALTALSTMGTLLVLRSLRRGSRRRAAARASE
jgi:uncharacterized spore protein YtfJ